MAKFTPELLEKVRTAKVLAEEDIEWLRKIEQYPGTYELLLDYNELCVGMIGNTEDFAHVFDISTHKLIEFLLIVAGIQYGYV